MRKLDFYGLPRSLQDRFLESVRGAAVPSPLAIELAPSRRPLGWGLASLAGFGLWAAFTAVGFGDLKSPWALGTRVHLALHGLFALVVIYCALRAYASSWETNQALVGDGFYLFPSGIIEVRSMVLTDHDAKELSEATLESGSLVITGNSRRFTFSGIEKARLDEVQKAFSTNRTQWSRTAEENSKERARFHPLIESSVPKPLAPTQPHQRRVFLSWMACAVVALSLATVLGVGVSRVRDSFSERELYRAAVRQNTVASYRAYLARGGARPDVAQVFLPRAELEVAMRSGSVDAIEAFIAKHPATRIGSEVEAVRRAALLTELAEARKVGTLAAIETLEKKYPAHQAIAPELAAARKETFVRAFANFQNVASPKNPELIHVVKELLAYAEDHGPAVRIRFAHQFPQSLEMLDSIVSKSDKYYLGRKSLPTQYFLGEAAAKREAALAATLIARLQQAFPVDVLRWEFGGPSPGENKELPPLEGPTLTITHRENLSGAFVGGKPKSIYLGATIVMTASLERPGRPELKFVYSTWRAPNFTVLVEKEVGQVYDEMMGGAFQAFGHAYLATWFAKP
jgi:hypothetical protein